ncbi:hypothetical protein CASFOL_002529 [Castilleja foliolosa]|uniref:Uncharacterized protein n=1 Tax=Castilleja foliolosa TaxID=1961234 RepID=A0ABD3EEU0_9LAMI
MRKISGQLISSKPVSLSRAAKHINQFASVDNGASAAVAVYLQRTAEALNHLVQFHKYSRNGEVEKSPDRKRARKLETDSVEKSPDEKTERHSKNRVKKEKTTFNEGVSANINEDEVQKSTMEEKEQRIPDEEMPKVPKSTMKKENHAVSEAAASNPSGDELQSLKADKKNKKRRKSETF